MIQLFKPDLHIHSNYSDGSDSPQELIYKAKEAGLDIFSLTDHDCYEGCEIIKKAITPEDPVFIGGIELSCEDETGKYHILGYCYNLDKPALKNAVKLTHETRMGKAKNRLDYLKKLGYEFSQEDVNDIMGQMNPGKPHFAKLLLKYGYTDDKAEAFEIVSGYHGKDFKLTPQMGIDAILQSDGIPILAHGILADGSKNLSQQDITDRVERLKTAGLMGVEAYYSSYSKEQKNIMLSLAKEYNLFVTAGSDYHGTNKTVRLGETGEADPREMSRFYRAVELLL